MNTTAKNTLNNEKGMIMVVVLMILVIITILGLSASQTSITEMQIATNENRVVDDFYNAEGGLINILETPQTWLTDGFLSAEIYEASYEGTVSFDGNNPEVEIRCIQDVDSDVSDANDLPEIKHISSPPVGSGYSLKYFEVRRYGVTVTSSPGNTQLQSGVWKVFNKF